MKKIKLTLDKETVAVLSKEQMKTIAGGLENAEEVTKQSKSCWCWMGTTSHICSVPPTTDPRVTSWGDQHPTIWVGCTQ